MAYFLVKWIEPKKDKGSMSHVLRSEIDTEDPIEVGMTVKAKYIRRYYKAEVIEVCEEEQSDEEEKEPKVGTIDKEEEKEPEVGTVDKEKENEYEVGVVVEERRKEGKATVEVSDDGDTVEKEEENVADILIDVGDAEVEEQNIIGEEEAAIEDYDVQPKRRRVEDFNILDFSESELSFSDGQCGQSSPKQSNHFKLLMEGMTTLLERSSSAQRKESDINENATIRMLLQRVEALEKEVRLLKSSRPPPPTSSLMPSKSTHPLPPDDDGVYLLGGAVPISNRAYRKCRSGTNKASSLSRSLLEVLFTNDELINCTLSGTRSNMTDRQPLSPRRMDAIFDEVDLVFPGSRISDERSIREAINGKCRYLRFTKKRDSST